MSSQLDAESTEWLRLLTADGAAHDAAVDRLHARLLRVAWTELRRRDTGITGPELDDVAHQATADAMVAVLAKLPEFRGESRFTTWIYRFVILEVSAKVGRHYWRQPRTALDGEDWARLPDRLGVEPERQAEARELVRLVRQAVAEGLTAHQRELFVAIVLDGTPLDAVVARTGLTRGAIYKSLFDARRNIRGFLVTEGYLTEPEVRTR